MDVAALPRKHHQAPTRFEASVEGDTSQGRHPKVFTRAHVRFDIDGQVEPRIALEAVQTSQTQFCGVSKMASKAFPVQYSVYVNGELVGEGNASFA